MSRRAGLQVYAVAKPNDKESAMAEKDTGPTARQIDVWGAYADSALALAVMEQNPDEREALAKARAALADGKTTGLAKAIKDALKVCVPDPASHPVRQGEINRARVNLEAVLEDLTGEPTEGAKEPATPVCIHCGWASSSKSAKGQKDGLVKHLARKHP
jgi:hypothetical protein